MENIQDRLMTCLTDTDKAYEEYARANGMTYLTLTVLEEIVELGDNCTQKQISEETHYPKQTINLVVKSFLEKGYIEMKEDSANRKNKCIRLTEEGRRVCEKIVEPMQRRERKILTDMGEEDCRELARLMEKYTELYCEGLREILPKKQTD